MAVQSAYRDAERTNDSYRSVKQYRDLNLNFTRHPITKDISPITDAAAIKRSVRNLIQYNYFEKPFHPEIGSGIRDLLFENISPFTAAALERKIKDVIVNFEPRVNLAGVTVIPNGDNNRFDVIIEFYIINSPNELTDITFALERLR